MKSMNLVFRCDLCSTLLEVPAFEPKPNMELLIQVNTRCKCYDAAIEEARTTAVDNILSAVRDMSKGLVP